MSLPIVQPTICPRELSTSASSGSGTLHVASRRMPTASPVATTFSAIALKKISGRSASYTLVVRRRAEVGLLHARGLAAQVRHARGPHFLPLDRRAEHDVRDAANRGQRLAIDPVQQRDGIGAFQHLRQRRDAGRRQIDDTRHRHRQARSARRRHRRESGKSSRRSRERPHDDRLAHGSWQWLRDSASARPKPPN